MDPINSSLTVSLPESLRTRIRYAAADNSESVSRLVRLAVVRELDRREAENFVELRALARGEPCATL